MFKRFFTFGSVVVLLFLIFVIFFFESISYWGGFAQLLRVVAIVSAVLHFSFVIYSIRRDIKDKEEGNLSDTIIKRKIKMLEGRGFIR